MMLRIQQFTRSLRGRADDRHNHARLRQLSRAVRANAPTGGEARPVAVFRASTGLLRLSQNAAFSLLAAWALRLSDMPVVHFVCRAGMSRCVQGLNRKDFAIGPPCRACVTQAERTYAGAAVHGFSYEADTALAGRLERLDLAGLAEVEHRGLPLGAMVLPSLRWILRRHHLPKDEDTQFLFRQFLLSAASMAEEFESFLERVNPAAVVVFNGTFFPEAIARRLAQERGLRVITHEVGMRPLSAFFTEGEATAYPIDLPEDFRLDGGQRARLDAYLSRRFQGDFSMAGIEFWPEMRRLDEAFLARAARYRQVVPVFSNVAFDTSQVHANTLFPHMFAWLDEVLEIIRGHPETLFVIRAHPDEARPNKISEESVAGWVRRRGVEALPNVVFIDPDRYLSSYELIQRSGFVLVYNSSIGLEAALLGAAVVCGGRARYTGYPIAHLPDTREGYRSLVERFLREGRAEAPEGAPETARRFLYYQLYRTSLPFNAFLEPHTRPGFVRLRDFSWQDLLPDRSPTLRAIIEGVQDGLPFLLGEEDDSRARAPFSDGFPL